MYRCGDIIMYATMTIDRAPSVYIPMTGWKLARWLLFYPAMILLDAAASTNVGETI